VVDATSTNLRSVSALKSNPGPDGKISLLEALTAVNNDYKYNSVLGHIINFSLAHGATIVYGHSLFLTAPGTLIDGDTNSDYKPDIVINGPDGYVSLAISSYGNQIQYLAITGISIEGTGAYLNQITGRYLGTDVEGKTARLEKTHGVQIIRGAYANVVQRCVIAGNTLSNPDKSAAGVLINTQAKENTLQANLIGINVEGHRWRGGRVLRARYRRRPAGDQDRFG